MSDLFYKYDNLPEDYVPDNSSPIYDCGLEQVIVRGTTPRHSFVLPYSIATKLSGGLSKAIITYKQGITTILEKTLDDISIIEDEETGETIIYFTLTQEESYLFEPTNLNNLVDIQIKLILSEGDVLVTPVYHMAVVDSLNQDIIGGGEQKDG